MAEISENAKKALKVIFTDFFTNYNSNNIRKRIQISNAGSLKLLRNLRGKNILASKKMGKAIFYKPNLENDYVLKLLELICLDHTNLSSFVKGLIYDLREFASLTKAVFLFGSILRKGKNARDVDVCFILRNPKDYSRLQNKVDEMNKKNRLKMHPLYLTKKDFKEKLKEKDKPLVDLVKNCVVVHGEDLFVEAVKNAQS